MLDAGKTSPEQHETAGTALWSFVTAVAVSSLGRCSDAPPVPRAPLLYSRWYREQRHTPGGGGGKERAQRRPCQASSVLH